MTLECHVRGEPRPVISWMKEGMEIKGDRFKQRELDDGVCQLVISEPVRADQGAYACIAENRVKREQIVHFVEFEGKEAAIKKITAPIVEEVVKVEAPKRKVTTKKGKAKAKEEPTGPVDMKNRLSFVSHLNDRTVAVGSKLKLMCLVNGPEPNIKWTKNNCNIVVGPRVKNATKEGTALIEILNVLEEDVGEWKCIAKNAAGEISTTCKLSVFEFPPEDIIPPTFSRPISGNFCTILI